MSQSTRHNLSCAKKLRWLTMDSYGNLRPVLYGILFSYYRKILFLKNSNSRSKIERKQSYNLLLAPNVNELAMIELRAVYHSGNRRSNAGAGLQKVKEVGQFHRTPWFLVSSSTTQASARINGSLSVLKTSSHRKIIIITTNNLTHSILTAELVYFIGENFWFTFQFFKPECDCMPSKIFILFYINLNQNISLTCYKILKLIIQKIPWGSKCRMEWVESRLKIDW